MWAKMSLLISFEVSNCTKEGRRSDANQAVGSSPLCLCFSSCLEVPALRSYTGFSQGWTVQRGSVSFFTQVDLASGLISATDTKLGHDISTTRDHEVRKKSM